MKFNNTDDDDDGRDYFDGPEVEDPKIEKPKRFKPDEPEYYDGEESQWEHLMPGRRNRVKWIIALCVVVILLGIGAYLRYFAPYSEDSTQYGYVESITTRGNIFKTCEGVLLPYKELMDTTRVYRRDFIFSVANKKIGAQLKRWQIERRPVKVQYDVYHTAVPWRGETKIIITAVDTVDPSKILPPEFTPEYYRNRDDLRDSIDAAERERLIEDSTEE